MELKPPHSNLCNGGDIRQLCCLIYFKLKKMKLEKLKKIYENYHKIEWCDNFNIGGGLNEGKFASNRHEDACDDEGKLTLGKATQLFKKATGLDVDTVREVIKYATPNMEWHHAGLLPKSYGGGMKKTYFLNAKEICDVASNWNDYLEKLNLSKTASKNAEEEKKNLEERKLKFLQANAKKVKRVSIKEYPEFFYQTSQEMLGEYGWFDSSEKSYNLPEFYTGWVFAEKKTYTKFISLFLISKTG